MDNDQSPAGEFREGMLDWIADILDRFAGTVENVEAYTAFTELLVQHQGRVPESTFRISNMFEGDREYASLDEFNRAMRWQLENYRAQIAFAREMLRIMMERPDDEQSQMTAAERRYDEAKQALDRRKPA